MEHLAESAGKGGIVLKAAVVADFRDRRGCAVQQPARKEQPLAVDVLVEAVACFLLEMPHEIVFAEIGLFRKPVDGELVCKVFLDVAEKRLDFFIVMRFMRGEHFVAVERTVQKDHELNKEQFGIKPMSKALLMGCFFQPVHVVEQVVARPFRHMHDAGVLFCQLEAGGQAFPVPLIA